jgi:lysophospholipase L1-like esterase
MVGKHNDIRICFVGESFVNGTGDSTFLGWTGRLCTGLVEQDFNVTHYNLGIRRETSTELLQRWEAECDRRFAPGCDSRIVFSFGTNDTTLENGKTRVALSESIANTRQILSVASQKCPVLMISPGAIVDDKQNQRTQTLSHHFAQLCKELNIPYLDVIVRLQQCDHWVQEVKAGDGAHPNAKGYAEYAELVQNWSIWKNWFQESPGT